MTVRALTAAEMATFHQSVRESLQFTVTATACGEVAAYAMCAVSVLSDAEELAEAGKRHATRREIGKAKYLLAQVIKPLVPS